MNKEPPREALDRLIRERGENYGALSRLIGRNSAYIQQFVKRGTPRKLDEADRRILARYFGVDETMLGGPDVPLPRNQKANSYNPARARRDDLVIVPRLALGASAGAGSLDEDESVAEGFGVSKRWLRDLGGGGGGGDRRLSVIQVDGESMVPTLGHGDDIMVDHRDGTDRLRDGIYVLRLDDVLMVKRVAMTLRRDRFSIRSDNSAFPSWEDIDPASVTIVGRVIWAGRRVG